MKPLSLSSKKKQGGGEGKKKKGGEKYAIEVRRSRNEGTDFGMGFLIRAKHYFVGEKL